MFYSVSDLDIAFDKLGTEPSLWHKRGAALEEGKAKLIDKVKDGVLVFSYAGRHKERLSNLTVAPAKWLNGWLSRLSDQQLQDTSQAANYSPEDTRMITKVIRARITELGNLK